MVGNTPIATVPLRRFVLRLASGGVHFFEHPHGMAQKGLALRRGLCLAFHPVKEPPAQFSLQFLNLLAEGRL